MPVKKTSLLLPLVLSAFLNGCALEDETAEKIVVPVEEKQEYSSLAEETFTEYAKKCTTGDMSAAPKVVHMYVSSLQSDDFDKDLALPELEDASGLNFEVKPYEYQKVNTNLIYEMCLQKAVSEGHQEYLNYFVTRGTVSAKIARQFYSEELLNDGAYWSRRVTNLLGLKTGYYIMGRLFCNNDKTFSIGADLLKEAAKLGDENAKQYLFDIALNNNVFEKLSKNKDSLKD